MRLWLSKSSAVPLLEQLVSQIVLGIVSSELTPGERLPSTRDLSRRYRVHYNTVSAAYKRLEERGWITTRQGSGTYVADSKCAVEESKELELDARISTFVRECRSHGFGLQEVCDRIQHWLQLQAPDHFLLIEPDDALRKVLVAEVGQIAGMRVIGVHPKECSDLGGFVGAVALTLTLHGKPTSSVIPPSVETIPLKLRSVSAVLQGQSRPPSDALLALVSYWPELLKWARTIVVAVGLKPESVLIREAGKPGWKKGLEVVDRILCDCAVASELSAEWPIRRLQILADESLNEILRVSGCVVGNRQ